MTARSTHRCPALLAGGLARNQIRIPDGAGIVRFAAPLASSDFMPQVGQGNVSAILMDEVGLSILPRTTTRFTQKPNHVAGVIAEFE